MWALGLKEENIKTFPALFFTKKEALLSKSVYNNKNLEIKKAIIIIK